MKNLLKILLLVFIFSCKKEVINETKTNIETYQIKDKARLEALLTTTQSVYFTFQNNDQSPQIQFSQMKVWYFSNSATETQLQEIINNSSYNLSELGTPALDNECKITSFENNYIRKILAFNQKAIILFYFSNSSSPEPTKYIKKVITLIPKVQAVEGILKNTLYQRITVNTVNLTF